MLTHENEWNLATFMACSPLEVAISTHLLEWVNSVNVLPITGQMGNKNKIAKKKTIQMGWIC